MWKVGKTGEVAEKKPVHKHTNALGAFNWVLCLFFFPLYEVECPRGADRLMFY